MDRKGVTLEQLADFLGYEIRSQGNHKYIRMRYDGYFRRKVYYNIIVYQKKNQFIVYCRVNFPKATISEMIVEQNGIKIVIEETINQAITKILAQT